MGKRHAVIIEEDGYTGFSISLDDGDSRDGGNTRITGSEPWEDGINGPDRRVAEHRIVALCEEWDVGTMEIHTEHCIKIFVAEFDSKGGRHWTGKVTPKQDGEWYDAENGFETYADMLYATGKDPSGSLRFTSPIYNGEDE